MPTQGRYPSAMAPGPPSARAKNVRRAAPNYPELDSRPRMPPFETPWDVEGPQRTWFYHRTTLPEIGEVGEAWDLRDCTDAYLGNYGFEGKRVLDVGCASGYLSFEMEKRGAEVVSFDIDDGANWNVVPHFQLRDELPEIRAAQSDVLVRQKRAYWLAHRLLDSRAKANYGDIYAMDDDLGEFDVIYYGMVIGHLRDPYQALYQGAKRCREAIIVTSIFEVNDTPRAGFIPSGERWDNLGIKSWWSPTTGLMKSMLGTLGFEVVDIVESHPIVLAEGLSTDRPDMPSGRRHARLPPIREPSSSKRK